MHFTDYISTPRDLLFHISRRRRRLRFLLFCRRRCRRLHRHFTAFFQIGLRHFRIFTNECFDATFIFIFSEYFLLLLRLASLRLYFRVFIFRQDEARAISLFRPIFQTLASGFFGYQPPPQLI